MYAIVMAGGSGTRLWPLSRRKTPKQLLPLTGEVSLLQQSVARLEPLLQPHDIYVITAESHVHATQRQLPQLPEGNILGEPLARSTAVAAALGAVLARRQTDEVAIVLPADHYVADADAFLAAIREAVVTAERGYLVVLGVTPAHPATGYGYVTRGEPLFATGTAAVTAFVEKPDAKTAKGLVAAGALWNAGVFVWSGYAFRQALERYQPALTAALDEVAKMPRTPGWQTDARALLEPLPAISIDAGIAEPAAAEGRMAVVALDAGWSDIGSWSALLEALSRQSGKSLVASGEHLDRGSKNVLVHGGERLVVTVGLKDVIIVDTPDALLVCARDRAEEIKPILDEIGEATGDRYL
jgi:mannose-1-phosphate guanylyltransferase